jgi:signal transduction histidine kinase
VGGTLGLSLLFIEVQAFETLHEFSRAHEEWELDEILLSLVALFISLSLSALIASIYLSQKLWKLADERLRVERQMAQIRKLQSMGTLLGGVAHSINNHLLPIETLSSLVREELPEESEEAQDLGRVIEAAKGARDMLRQVLNFTHQERHAGARYCSIGPTLEASLKLAATAIPSAIRLTHEVPPLNDRIAVSPVDLEVILLNLVSNSVDAIAGATGTIDVTLRLCEIPAAAAANNTHWVSLTVSDTGQGMTEEQKEHMFDPFFTSKPVGQGTGLGMSETFGIVTRAGGTLEVASLPGKGTKIALFFPVRHGPSSPETTTTNGWEHQGGVQSGSVRKERRKMPPDHGIDRNNGREKWRPCRLGWRRTFPRTGWGGSCCMPAIRCADDGGNAPKAYRACLS